MSFLRGIHVLLVVTLATVVTRASEPRVDSILIVKHNHQMTLLSGDRVLHSYRVALGRGGLAAKDHEGDALTPEGHYVIDSKASRSHYHKALHISYPNAADRERAARKGLSPGGAVMIHGLPDGRGWLGPLHRLYDWTLGCVAVTNGEMDEIWPLVGVGTPVEIKP